MTSSAFSRIVRIKRLSDVIRCTVAPRTSQPRYGGDEFAVGVDRADPGMSRQIRSVNRALRTRESGQKNNALSVCIGISVYPDDGSRHKSSWKQLTQHLLNERAFVAAKSQVSLEETDKSRALALLRIRVD